MVDETASTAIRYLIPLYRYRLEQVRTLEQRPEHADFGVLTLFQPYQPGPNTHSPVFANGAPLEKGGPSHEAPLEWGGI